MTTWMEQLGIDVSSPSMLRASHLAESDRALVQGLIAVRKKQGLSQQDVAERLGVTQATISRFESSDSNPTLASIRRYAHAVEALVQHVVEPDTGQLLDPEQRGGWLPGHVDVAAPKLRLVSSRVEQMAAPSAGGLTRMAIA